MALLFLGATFSNSSAQNLSSLPTTVVTAYRTEQPITDVLSDVSVIDQAEIVRSGIGSLSQLLSRLPGLQTITGADAERVYIRGADSRMTALYIDGVRVDLQDGISLIGGGAPWELIPLSAIDHVEVLRGPSSAVYGSDAMGGVIQIFTKKGDNNGARSRFSPFANIGVDTLSTRRLSTGFNGAGEGWDYNLGLGIVDSDGINTRPDLVKTPDREAFTQRSANFSLGRQITQAQRLEFNSLDTQFDSRYVPFGGGTAYQAKSQLNTSSLKLRSVWSDLYSTDLTVNRSRIVKRDDAPNDYVTRLNGILFENRLKVAGGVVTAVLEEKRDQFEAQPSAYDPAFTGSRSQNGAAVGYGLRRGAHAMQINTRADRDSLFGIYQTGAFSYGYFISPDWRATASSGTAFRAPTLEQIYGPYGSPQLLPETNRSSEIGLQFSEPNRSFKAVIYRNEFRNLISSSSSLATCSAGFFCYFNVGRAVIQGLTLSSKLVSGPYEYRGSYDVLDPRDEITGRDLSLRARQVLNVGVDRQVQAWRFGGELKAVGERFNNASNTERLPAYMLASISAGTMLSKEWRFVARLDNITNAKYQQVLNFATPGRTFFMGLNWQPTR